MRRLRTGSGAPLSLILALVFPAMTAASVALAYYGYLHAENASRPLGDLFIDMSRASADDATKSLEARIDREVQGLMGRVAAQKAAATQLETPLASDQGSPCEPAPGPAIRSYVVLDGARSIECVGPATAAASARATEKWSQIARTLPWSTLKPNGFAYYHAPYEAGSLLVAYASRSVEDHRYYVAARFDLEIIAGWLEDELGKLRKERRVVILDKDSAVISGSAFATPAGGEERFLYEATFGKALYGWRIQIAPQNVEAFRASAERQKVLRPLLIFLSTAIIAVGLGIVWLVVLAERRASRLKSDFIANVSHELKTPLSLIRMFGELVATGKHKGQETAREYGGIITRESERLSHLIDNVLDFARLERGKASYHFDEGALGEVVERALDICRYRLDKERLRLRTEIAADLPPVRMDDNAMTLVILNLVDNAIKYAADGGEVVVSLARNPGGVVLSVRDFGPGIAPEEQGRIFERFYRAQNARERNVRGSGIGLALVQHIAEAHGGRVSVESPVAGADRRGALFRVYLPAAPLVDGAEPSPALSDVSVAKT